MIKYYCKGGFIMYQDIYFKCQTGIYIVENGLQKAGKIIKQEGFTKVFIVYGSSYLEKSSNLQILIKSLEENGIEYKYKGGIKPNPDISFVRNILPEIKEYRPELLLAVGGGSVIDTAKSICAGYYYDKDPLDFNKYLVELKKALPIATILTLSASGSEMSTSCVMSEYETGFKKGFNSVLNRPLFSIEDPLLTLSVSQFQTFAGLVDIISHSFERYFSPSYKYQVCDYFALSIIKQMVEIAPILINNPSNLDARRSMMVASTLSHNGITSFDKPSTKFICHKIEHKMSGTHPKLTHGLGLRFLLAEFMDINKDVLSEKINKFGKFVFDINSQNPCETINKFKEFLNSLPLPKSMTEVGFTKQEEQKYIDELKL